LAQGELVSSEKVPEGKKTTFRNSLPVSYFSLDIGRYTVTSRKAGDHTLSVYLLDASSSLSKQCLDVTEKALAYYETHFGSFPYTRYGVVQTKGVSEMALEAYSFATFGPHTLPDLIPHELSHTWWGGRIPCTYLRSMWNEAFADYSDDLFRRSVGRRVQPTAAEVAADRRKTAHVFDAMPLGSACDTNNGTQSTIGYDKGSRVLRLLEFELGLDTMLKCIADFLTDHRSGEAGDWAEFEAVVDRVTKSDYHWFFREWLDLAGLPNIRFENVSVQNAPSGKIIRANVVQAGMPYLLDLDCKVSTRTSSAIVSRQKIDGSRTRLEIPVDSEPVTITLDPAGIVPLAPPPGGEQDSDYTTFRFGR
jgi:aminopeptidase N